MRIYFLIFFSLVISTTSKAQGIVNGYNERCFEFYCINESSETVRYKVNAGDCYEGAMPNGTVSPPVAPGGKWHFTICRVQGHGCNGEQGRFNMQIIKQSGTIASQDYFDFDNQCNLTKSPSVTLLSSKLVTRTKWDLYYYEWKLREFPSYPSFTPPNKTASALGNWDGQSPISSYKFNNTDRVWGNFYEDCAGVETWHPQHIVRLKNKRGADGKERAYFMVAQSREHNGYIEVLETLPGALDPNTDLIKGGDGSVVGNIIWNDVYTGSFNGTLNPIGNWNHPCKMDVCGDILVVTMQNFVPSGCPTYWNPTRNPAGTSDDALVFYDVQDPASPKFLGKMTGKELGMPNKNRAERSWSYPEISSVALFKAPNQNFYILSVGGNGGTRNFRSNKISMNPSDWTYMNDNYLVGQHGQNFMVKPEASSPEQMYYFDMTDDTKYISFMPYTFNSRSNIWTSGTPIRIERNAPGANRDWDADGLYINKFHVPVIYSVKSQSKPYAEIYQLSLSNTVPNLNNKIFKIISNHPSAQGKALDADGLTLGEDGTKVQLWAKGGQANQQWKFIKVAGTDTYNIVNMIPTAGAHKYLDADGLSIRQNGTKIQLWTQNSGAQNQNWKVVKNANGSYSFMCVAPEAGGKFLEVDHNGSRVQLWGRNDTSRQQWILEEVK